MLSFLLPLAAKVIQDSIAKIPDNEELGEKLIDICLVILSKAVKLTKTDMDDQSNEKLSLKQFKNATASNWLFINIL